MAHWFHRNPLKATSPVTFDLKAVLVNSQSLKICGDLRHARKQLLDILCNANNEVSTLAPALESYLSLLHGFLMSHDPEKLGESKLRNIIKFRWTNTMGGSTPVEQQDAVFEVASMLFNVALWYTKHAASLASKEEPTTEEAKEVHKSLRVAAGIFTHIKDDVTHRLIDHPAPGSDLEMRTLTAYTHQCTAEAQEVTIARAIEMKHAPGIVSALAYQTAKMFTDADNALTTLDEKVAGKWRKYLQFKTQIYYAYAYSYFGETLLAEDKCGQAIRCLQESTKQYEKATSMANEYGYAKGPGTNAKPQQHLFFRKLGPIVKRTLDKCERENGFIYHQKVPPEPPALEMKQTFGLVSPEEFTPPDPSPLWTPGSYKAFDLTKNAPPDPKEEKKNKGDIPPVKEADINQTNKDPNNTSGCVVS